MAKTSKAKTSQEAGQGPICASMRGIVCFVCANYVRKASRSDFTTVLQTAYKTVYSSADLRAVNQPYAGSSVCSTCKTSLRKGASRFRHPAVWHEPTDEEHGDCYICNIADVQPARLLRRKKPLYQYPTDLSCTRPERPESKTAKKTAAAKKPAAKKKSAQEEPMDGDEST